MSLETFNKSIWNIEKNHDEFVYLAKNPSLVLFYDEKSKPCQDIKPVIDTLSNKYNKKINFYSTNVAKEQVLCDSLKISVVPTVIIFSKDRKLLVVEGLLRLHEYENIINGQILKE